LVGAVASQARAEVYWDSDANAVNNNVGPGAGLGGSGVWSNAGANWFNGSTDAAWIANSDAVFEGTAGTVTLSGAKSANSLTFKTTGYTLGDNVSQITMAGPYITTDAGVTATIGAQLSGSAGLIKNGPGTLVLTNGNGYSGGTSIVDGILAISADTSLGAVPLAGNPNGRDITLDGGTLRLNANVTINSNRQFMFGPNGGTIDTQSFPNSSYVFAEMNHGPGDLTKIGTGTWYAQGGGNANAQWTGRLIIKEGTWRIRNVSSLPYDIPVADGVKADQVILDGGTLLVNESGGANITNVRRGITVAAGGGTISGGMTWAGPVTSSVPNAVLNLNGVTLKSSAVPSTFQGTINVGLGGLQLNGGTAMGDTAAIVLPNTQLPPATSLEISGGTETIGSLAGGGPAAELIHDVGAGLIKGNDNSSTTFSGKITNSGSLAKIGSGTFTLTNDNNYSGGTTVNGGTLLVNNPPSATGTGHSGTGSGTIVVNAGGTLGGTGNHNGSVTINDGGLVNGPARIFGSALGFGGVTVNSGGTLAGNIAISGGIFSSLSVASGGHVAPGASIGTINADYLTLSAGSILDFELDTVLGVDKSDLINVLSTGGTTINGGTINLRNLGNMTVGTYILIDYTGNMSGSINNLSFGTVPAGFSYSLNNNTSNKSIELIVGVVPEPATWLLCAMAAAVPFYRTRHERSRMA
jgi:autotransporter-associated beta strand protein